METKVKLSINLGLGTEPISKQLEAQHLKYDQDIVAALEKNVEAINKLRVSGFLFHSWADKLYGRILIKIQDHANLFNAF